MEDVSKAAATKAVRPWTPDRDEIRPDGTRSKVITVKRCCNGCGAMVGDVTEAEIEASIGGQGLPDVRDECPSCLISDVVRKEMSDPEEMGPVASGVIAVAERFLTASRDEMGLLLAAEQRVRDLHSERILREHDPVNGHETGKLLQSICSGCTDSDVISALDDGELIEEYEGVSWPCKTRITLDGGESA